MHEQQTLEQQQWISKLQRSHTYYPDGTQQYSPYLSDRFHDPLSHHLDRCACKHSSMLLVGMVRSDGLDDARRLSWLVLLDDGRRWRSSFTLTDNCVHFVTTLMTPSPPHMTMRMYHLNYLCNRVVSYEMGTGIGGGTWDSYFKYKSNK